VDGSGSSKAALRWAIREARLTGASVDAVMAWGFPATYAPLSELKIELACDARTALGEAIMEVGGLEPGELVRPLVAEGYAAQVLLQAARDADLLVVGSRGRGGFASALVGSVSLHCVLHARCPVLVVRDGHEGQPQD
jgi:nucleotide-binding universal stress UspA family protein